MNVGGWVQPRWVGPEMCVFMFIPYRGCPRRAGFQTAYLALCMFRLREAYRAGYGATGGACKHLSVSSGLTAQHEHQLFHLVTVRQIIHFFVFFLNAYRKKHLDGHTWVQLSRQWC